MMSKNCKMFSKAFPEMRGKDGVTPSVYASWMQVQSSRFIEMMNG